MFEGVVDESGWGLSEREHMEDDAEEELEAAGQQVKSEGGAASGITACLLHHCC